MAWRLPEGKNWLDLADIVIKGLATTLVTIAITYYGISSETKRAEIAEENRNAQIVIQTLSNRESAASDLKARMFDSLMNHYFVREGSEESITRARELLLRLIALNFHANFNLRPLFDDVNSRLEVSERAELRKAAKAIAKIQINSLVAAGGYVCKYRLVSGKTVASMTEPNCPLPIELILIEINDNGIRVKTPGSGDDDLGFQVSYYDMPLVDNSTIGNVTYSLILSDAYPRQQMAAVKMAVFPENYFNAKNSLRFDQLIGSYVIKASEQPTAD